MITDHPYKSPEPRTKSQRENGELTPMLPCFTCGEEYQFHWELPESERTWALPYRDPGPASFPAPVEE